jgi:alkylation response protein AidB-like acyl-CoA dehydrogenase
VPEKRDGRETHAQEAHAQETRAALREEIRALCARYPSEYWGALDRERVYPEAFVRELTDGGYLACLIPEMYGGAGLGMAEAALILEEINRSGGNAAACHAQMYTMGTLLRHGTEEQKARWLPAIADGDLRLQAFAVTEPDAGSDTSRITTFAERRGDRYVVNGRKVFISRVGHSDLMLLLARTTSREDAEKKTDGLSAFVVDLRDAGDTIRVAPIETMINHDTSEVVFDDLEVPVENRIGEDGRGFGYILAGMNAERLLLASESIGDALFFVDRCTRYANERVVFDRPIGRNQGVQFPIARAYIATRAASAMRDEAVGLYDAGEPCGAEANMSKLLASEAAWKAANVAMDVFGGYGLATEFGIERKFREARLYLVAPVANNLVLGFVAQHVLGLPRSF